jgi:hypothetical protein
MIPSTNSKLLVAEDWIKIYQSFRNADFKSYDFETLRRTMIQYLQENYPEDFNDFIESSEFIALVDLLAYLGQNLSFRIDLNARENFLETAQRRDSILRLAQLISYVPKRNTPSSGFLKITSLSTTDNVLDANGINLSNSTIAWNDPTNPSWYQQFITVLNSAMTGVAVFGKPFDRNTIDGILTEQYRLNSTNTDVPVYSFLKNINGTNMNFEVTSCAFSGSTSIYEEPPRPANTFSLIYKNDNQGSGSINTGFFVHFRQGRLGLANFEINAPVPNEIIGINTPNINDTDVWLWQLDSNGNYGTLWTKVPAVTGNNIIYNSVDRNERNIYSVTSRDRDQIDLNFADGAFGNLPKGKFVLIYRQSNGLSYSIKPEQLSGIIVNVPYANKSGQIHSLSLTLNLQYTVNNSSGPESNNSIQSKAPQAYYTQNRMVTAEDYNITPLTLGNDILKVKSVARATSGLSKYFDLSDVTGKYSQTNIFANDGIIYKNSVEENFEFEFTNRNEVYAVIKQRLAPILASTSMRSFYFDNYSRPSFSELSLLWKLVNRVSSESRGYFYSTINNAPANVGSFTTDNLKFVSPGALIKFQDPDNKIIWTKIVNVIGDGSNSGLGLLDDGTGPIIVSDIIPDGSIPIEVIPKFINVYSFAFETELVNLCINQRNFGLSFNQNTRVWNIILDTNLNILGPFDLSFQGDKTNSSKDASWLISFTWTGKNYKVRYRLTDYIFESEKQTSFFVDPSTINYDFTSDSVVKDQITVLSINTQNNNINSSLGEDYLWQIDGSKVEPDGYVEPKKVKVSFYDYNSSGQIDNPDTFTEIVGTGTTNFVYFETLPDGLRYRVMNTATILPYQFESDVLSPIDNQLYYFYDLSLDVVKSYSTSTAEFIYQPKYYAYPGRKNLKFQYQHNSSEDRRIDPSKSNLIDVYLLTNEYDIAYRSWLFDNVGTNEPLAPTSQGLEQSFGGKLELLKTISDEIIFQPVKYKILFGSKADINLQAIFKAVRNSTIPISDNEIKSQILDAINQFFALENWDFGQSFYFSELVTYVMNLLTPNITNFVIVPRVNNFGSLYEITCLSNEIFISGATVSDIEVIDGITAAQLRTSSILTNSGS